MKSVGPRLITLIVVAGLVTSARVSAQEGAPPPLPPPGKLVDVGGWRLHINCTGTASPQTPTVILESGIGDFSVEWSLVQPGVSKFARVCSYDRAGDGWSEMGPFPRTYKQIVYELHALVERAGERPPFVLVGQSYGGWLVRVYRSTYPSDVAGMVFVDAGDDNPERITRDGTVVRADALVKGVPVPEVKTSGPLRISDIPAGALAAIRAGNAKSVPTANDPPRDKLPEDAKKMRTWALAQIGHVAAGVNSFEIEELALIRGEREKNPQAFGDIPVIVITRGRGEDSPEQEAARREGHKLVAAMSRKGRHVIADKSGHHVHIEQPDLVVSLIEEVVRARK
jgi:pimeloyl-ACP methyl ester carboxylesterase